MLTEKQKKAKVHLKSMKTRKGRAYRMTINTKLKQHYFNFMLMHIERRHIIKTIAAECAKAANEVSGTSSNEDRFS